MNENKYFISTTLPYLNSVPHIGHCFEFVIADIIARFYIIQGKNVIFNVGVDEHGTKIFHAAQKEGLKTQEFCDKYAEIWKEFCKKFQIGYTNFYRTTDKKHKKKARHYFELFNQKDFVFENNYSGYYCDGCEAFKTEKEVEGGKCIIHRKKTKLLSEKNVFFGLHYFKDKIKDILINKSLSNELKNNIDELSEISITRRNVEWGVKYDDEQTLYVWAEALLSYCFAAGYDPLTDDRHSDEYKRFTEYWKNSLIICGKDNLKFQAYILQALLLAQDLPQTKGVLVHGTILDKDGVKMSKTIGNVIDPIVQLKKYGVSPVRYYLFLGLSTFNDSCYSEEALINLWNADIVNGYGNFINRLIHLMNTHVLSDEKVKMNFDWINEVNDAEIKLNLLFETYNFQQFKIDLNAFVSRLNKRISDEKPYAKDCENRNIILMELFYGLMMINRFYIIIIPEFKEKLEDALLRKIEGPIFPKIYIEQGKAIIK